MCLPVRLIQPNFFFFFFATKNRERRKYEKNRNEITFSHEMERRLIERNPDKNNVCGLSDEGTAFLLVPNFALHHAE